MPWPGNAVPSDVAYPYYIAATRTGHHLVTADDVLQTLSNPDYTRVQAYPHFLAAVPAAGAPAPYMVFTPTPVADAYPYAIRHDDGRGVKARRYRTLPEALLALINEFAPRLPASRIHPADPRGHFRVDHESFFDDPLPWHRSVFHIQRETTPVDTATSTPDPHNTLWPTLALTDADRADAPVYRVQPADALDATLSTSHRLIPGDKLRSSLRYAIEHTGQAAMSRPDLCDGIVVYRHGGDGDHTSTSGLVIAYPPCAICGFGPSHPPFSDPTWTRQCLGCQEDGL
ncbi:hypothetical protein SAZ11_08510 [Streptomyces sp. FXJ1.4098]|nr:hypothetical protein [Streptomyces sp. FXJ1.4098]